MLHGRPTLTSSRVSTILLPVRQKFYLDDIFVGYFMTLDTTMGNMEGVCYWDFLREKENAYLDSFFLEPEDIKSLSGGHLQL